MTATTLIKKNAWLLLLILIALLLIVLVIVFFNKRIEAIEMRQPKTQSEHPVKDP